MRLRVTNLKHKAISSLIFLLAVYALWFWLQGSLQFLRAYYQEDKFDVSIFEFFIFVVPLFTPLVTFGALIVAGFIMRLRLWYWMRKHLSYSEYQIDFSPAEAGIILDYMFDSSEIAATLLDLHFRRVIKMDVRGTSINLELLDKSKEGLSVFEHEFLDQIFKYEKHRSFTDCNDKYLRTNGHLAHKAFLESAKESGVLMNLLPKKIEPFMPILALLAFAGFLMSLAALWVQIFDREGLNKILPKTYPVYPIELVFIALITLWGVLVILSGFWPRFSANHKSKPVAAWVKTYGLKMFLKTVYADRFSPNNISHQPSVEVKKYAPYMIAFNLAPNDTLFLKQALMAGGS